MSEYIALTLAGIMSPILTQVIKKWLQWQDFKALLLTAATAAILAVVAMWSTGELISPQEVVLKITAVFGLATLIYKSFTAGQAAATSDPFR